MQYLTTKILTLCLSTSLVSHIEANYHLMHPQELRLHHRTTRGADLLRCPPCEQLHCSPRKSKLKCKGGVALGICNCCPRCARLEGESCRGKWNYLGDCDSGLVCNFEEGGPYAWQTENVTPDHKIGTCRRVPSGGRHHGRIKGGVQAISDEGHAPIGTKCEPKCTPDYCATNPKAICSAVDNADEKQECQGECQHTSCMACQFVEALPDCGRCGPNDFRCMRQFAKCLKRNLCQKKQYPCGKQHSTEETAGKFQCRVPMCRTGR